MFIYKFIYIYIYLCVCVCVCVSVDIHSQVYLQKNNFKWKGGEVGVGGMGEGGHRTW